MVAAVQSQDGRRAKRHAVTWKGTISHGIGRETTVCIIKDVSPSGAQLVVPSDRNIPDRFLLKIANGAKMFRCLIVWRRGQILGVRFLGTYPRWVNES